MEKKVLPDSNGHFESFGGKYVPEALSAALTELETAFQTALVDSDFWKAFNDLRKNYAGRPTPLTVINNFAKKANANGAVLVLKREDLNHTGSHKINNVLGQALLAKRMGKTRVIAETGAGQHGVATATAAALLGLKCRIYMGKVDTDRQALNVARMQLLGAEVVAVEAGSKTLKDAMNEAMRDWVASVDDTHYLIGTVAGPHPFPLIVREFQRVISSEAKTQCLDQFGRLPDVVCACVGGGSNAMGIFADFIPEKNVALYGFEAGGEGITSNRHAAAISGGSIGVLHGTKTFILQDEDGQTLESHSISAGLDYPGVGPEHAWLASTNRAIYQPVTDTEAMLAFQELSQSEGIIPAIESAHAIAGAKRLAQELLAQNPKEPPLILICLSGRGDKDVNTACQYFNLSGRPDSYLGGEND